MILVTGGAGFLGSHLLPFLVERGEEVIVLDDLSTGKRTNVPKNVKFIEGSILNKRDVKIASKDVELVFHLAAKVSVPESIKDPFMTFEVNNIGTLNVLEENKDAKFVYVSSAAVYGNSIKIPISEEEKLSPISPYGASKIYGEISCKLYQNMYGTKITIVRPFNIYGEGQDPTSSYSGVISKFTGLIRGIRPLVVFGDGNDIRDYVHVSDVCNGVLAVVGRDGIYNIGTGKPTTTNQLAELIKKICGPSSQIIHTSPRDGDIRESLADISRLKNLGWEPKVNLEEGIKNLINYS